MKFKYLFASALVLLMAVPAFGAERKVLVENFTNDG